DSSSARFSSRSWLSWLSSWASAAAYPVTSRTRVSRSFSPRLGASARSASTISRKRRRGWVARAGSSASPSTTATASQVAAPRAGQGGEDQRAVRELGRGLRQTAGAPGGLRRARRPALALLVVGEGPGSGGEDGRSRAVVLLQP